ncbi:phosphatase inhibitor-domain-containing protein [Thamnocephalis sphaerospora]|uniref:Type 1 phosphatases regulator n=1 Tax=Thamnocephalis sphaerospora TaxID=78915 RepID=A0A4P9XRZ9_9FUNG|nr:phosphatase inhibitor-domain-containing protein [Thamnocephalis sphaerospora]|eukprot:RKP08876.1 phosphatase inhibitor-domain-containing protein [Thamnocephalis sphaerospora]
MNEQVMRSCPPASAANGSQTVTEAEALDLIPPAGVLHLSGANTPALAEHSATLADEAPRRRIHWDESVVDNEHLNRKKSKICCIFRKQRAFDESSSGESSTSSSSDEYSSDDTAGSGDGACAHHGHHHHHGHRRRRRRRRREPGPNAYEKAPRYGMPAKKQNIDSAPKDEGAAPAEEAPASVE